jgi:hypothetical protein
LVVWSFGFPGQKLAKPRQKPVFFFDGNTEYSPNKQTQQDPWGAAVFLLPEMVSGSTGCT